MQRISPANQTGNTERLLGAQVLAVKFGVSPDTVYRWRRDGILPEPVLSGPGFTLRWLESDIDAWLVSGSRPGDQS